MHAPFLPEEFPVTVWKYLNYKKYFWGFLSCRKYQRGRASSAPRRTNDRPIYFITKRNITNWHKVRDLFRPFKKASHFLKAFVLRGVRTYLEIHLLQTEKSGPSQSIKATTAFCFSTQKKSFIWCGFWLFSPVISNESKFSLWPGQLGCMAVDGNWRPANLAWCFRVATTAIVPLTVDVQSPALNSFHDAFLNARDVSRTSRFEELCQRLMVQERSTRCSDVSEVHRKQILSCQST